MATAEWKKVIVSGSTAQLATLQVGSNQQIGTTQATTFLTGSFTGSFVGSGANLSGVTATFPGSNLTPLLSTTRIFSNDGVSSTSNTYVTAGQITGSAYAGVSGDITISAAGVASITAESVALGTDTTGNYVATIDPGNGLTGGAATGEGVAHTLAVGAGTHITVGANDVAVNTTTLTPAISGSIFTQISGDLTITAGGVATIGANAVAISTDVSGLAAGVATFLATPSSANLASALTDETGTAGSVVFSASPTFTGTLGASAISTTGNVTVGGDLTVNGTTTILDTTNLSVEDRFVVLNHGSGSVSPSQEGGIIIEGSTAGSGSAFYYDGDTVLRWGVALGVSDTATSVTANSYVVTVSGSNANPAGNPTYGGLAAGFGNMHVNSSDNSIWIFA